MYVVNIDLGDLKDAATREKADEVPTSFKLNEKQVDLVIDSGRSLLNQSACFKLFLNHARGQ